MQPLRTIAFVGLGNMGVPMAARLAAKGFALALYDRRPEAVAGFVQAHGGRASASLADSARGADAAIVMLPDDTVVRDVVLSEGGLAGSMAAGTVIIDMSTSNPNATIDIGAQVVKRGLRYVDAPVTGGVMFAKDGTLDVLAGGSDEDVAHCAPVFAAVGRQIIRCGGLGAGHALKVLANYVNAGALINVIEALAIGRKFGLESAVMADAMIDMCTGRQHPLEKKVIPQVLTHQFTTGMSLGLIAKDVSIAAAFGRSIGAMTPLADRVKDIWSKAEADFGGKADQTEVARLWETGNGITL